MKRKVFFSFHYERDAWRAGQVRNSDMISNEDEKGFVDAVAWEKIKQQGDAAIKRWILNQMEGTSVTVVLIGAETAEREWVDFEIRESWGRGNAVMGLYIHNVKDSDSKTDIKGVNPLDNIYFTNGQALSTVCPTYDFTLNDGRKKLGKWADQAVLERSQYRGEEKLKPGTLSKNSTQQQSYVPSKPTVISNPARPWAN